MASYRPISEEIAAPTTSGTASNVSSSSRVRVTNTTSSSQLLTILDSSDETIGSMTLVPSEVFTLNKRDADKVFAANTGVRLASITFPVL